MGKSRTTLMEECLWELGRQVPSIENCWITSVDGLIMAMMVWAAEDDSLRGSYSGGSFMLSYAGQLLAGLKEGHVEEIQIGFKDSRLVIRPIGEDAVLNVMHNLKSPPDLDSHHINRAISSLERLL